MPRVIGLDIGTFGVRAGEVDVGGGPPRLIRFGQLTLPPGAVVAGEIVDVEVVTATVRRLWERGKFGSRRVVLGLANQRVIVRQAEMPAMTEQDLAAALRFEAAEVLPIAAEDAVVDFQVLSELRTPQGEDRLQLLLAAAQRTMLDVHLEVCRLAGLRVVGIDPMPLALVRALGGTGLESLAGAPSTEAIVCVGAGITTVVVHQDGVPQFSRFVSQGAGAATEAVAAELGIDHDTAEDLKRRAGTGTGNGADGRADVVVARVVTGLVTEIDGSIQFYSDQHPEAPVGRVILVGAGSRLYELDTGLAVATGLPIEVPDLGQHYIVDAGLTEDETARAAPNFPTVVGLALAAVPLETGRKRINLVPAALVGVQTTRVQAATGAAAVAALAALLIGLWALRAGQVRNENNAAGQAQQQAANLNTEIAKFGGVTNLDSQIASARTQVDDALTGDVDWSGFLQQVAAAVPSDVWLTTFTGTAGAAGSTGTVSFGADGFSHRSAASWVERVGALPSLSGLWVPSSTVGGTGGGVTFTSTADLTPAALSNRASQYTGPG
jgi:type IV pilus assembly protein PilM